MRRIIETAAAATPASAGEWSAGRLDLAAYLRRIGHRGDTTPTAATLVALHRAHLAAIPFENLDIVLGRGVSVELEAIQDKLVHRLRGGYCYEHNLLFAAALEQIGYTVERLLARVGSNPERPPSHLVLRVRAGAGCWLADVGFGSGVLEPLAFDASGPQAQGGWNYELAVTGPASWDLRERQGGGWVTAYRFDDRRRHAADVQAANHVTSTSSQSPFVGRVVVVRKDTGALRRLLGREF